MGEGIWRMGWREGGGIGKEAIKKGREGRSQKGGDKRRILLEM